jgi:MarR family transcriptional regulator, multiple antibiotic resistance protein MarR
MPELFSDYYFWILFSQTWEAISKARQKELAPHNISEIRAALLFIIQLIGREATPAKISKWLFKEPHTVSEIVDRMVKDGLLIKVKDLDRKNQVRVELTKKGMECYKTSMIPDSIPNIASVLSKEEQKQFIRSLIKLRAAAIKSAGIQHEIPLPPVEKL